MIKEYIFSKIEEYFCIQQQKEIKKENDIYASFIIVISKIITNDCELVVSREKEVFWRIILNGKNDNHMYDSINFTFYYLIPQRVKLTVDKELKGYNFIIKEYNDEHI